MKIDVNALNDSFAATRKQQSESGDKFKAVLEAVKPSKAQQELDQYLKMSPQERMRAAILKQLGLTEEQLAALPPEQQKAVEDKIAALMKQKLSEAQHTGSGSAAGLI